MKVIYDTMGMEEMRDVTGRIILHHPKGKCKDQEACTIHSPSEHSLDKAPLFFADNFLLPIFFRVCDHGNRHPDPDSVGYFRSLGYSLDDNHECDGCCK